MENKLPIVEVEWLDACSDCSYCPVTDAGSLVPSPRRNVGYLCRDDDKQVTILWGLIDKDSAFTDDRFTIPRGMVTKITYLKERNE